MKLIDLSQIIEPGMPLFSPSAPQPKIFPYLSHQQAADSNNYQDCTCEITEINMVTSLGTYMDSPFHFDPTGISIEALTLEQLVLPGIVIDCSQALGQEAIDPNVLEGIDFSGKAVLLKTGWSNFWGQPKYFEFPFVSKTTAEVLRDGGAKLVGVDFLVIDDTTNPARPAHNTLLKNNILIVENLANLDKIPTKNFIFHAAPIKIRGAAAFPVRAYAVMVS